MCQVLCVNHMVAGHHRPHQTHRIGSMYPRFSVLKRTPHHQVQTSTLKQRVQLALELPRFSTQKDIRFKTLRGG